MTVYKISEAAEQAGFTASALRFYEASGLVPDAVRTPAGYRIYDETAVERLRFVHRARTLGLPLEEIKELVQIWDAGSCAPVQHDLAVHISERRDRVQDRIAELQTLAKQLRDAELAVLDAPGDGQCGPDCACLAGPAVTATEDQPLGRAGLVGLTLLTQRPRATADEPILACTLDVGQMPARLRAWRELVAEALSRELVLGGERLVFAPVQGLAARVAELCEREQGCCSFFTFTLAVSGFGVTLDITAPPSAGPLIAALLDRQP